MQNMGNTNSSENGENGGNGGCSKKFTLDDLKYLNINETKQEEGSGCVPDISGEQGGSGKATALSTGFGWPDNNEFDWGELGDSCRMNSFNYGCVHDSIFVYGKRPRVKRVAFNAPAIQCCIANTQNPNSVLTWGDKTCDPKNRNPTSENCKPILREYCGEYNRILDNNECKALQTTSESVFNQLMENTCNSNIENAKRDECVNWCSRNSSKCSLLNLKNQCVTLDICSDISNCDMQNCSTEKVNNLINKCQKHSIIMSSTGLKELACTERKINELLDECDKLGIPESSCTNTEIINKKEQQFNQTLADSARQRAESAIETNNKVQDAVDNIFNPNEDKPNKNENNNFIFIIIIIILTSIFSGSFLSISAILLV